MRIRTRLGYLILMECAVCLIATQIRARDESSRKDAPPKSQRPGDYKLVWADEFDKDGKPDPRKWTYETGFVRNEEAQWYQAENARCEKGWLIIEGKRERKSNPRYKADSQDWRESRKEAEYTSASLTTKGLHDWKYGRFRMRGRIDTRPGLWPAFWTLGTNIGEVGWPACGEIDVMEYYRGLLLANAAWASNKPGVPQWDDTKKPLTEFNDPDWSGKFHVWRMDWDERYLELYVDDQLLNSIDLKKTVNADEGQKNPFQQPHFLILNLAIGGTSGGDASSTMFPARYEIDYVRVYQRK